MKKWKDKLIRTENVYQYSVKGYKYWRGQIQYATSTYKNREDAQIALEELKKKFNITTPPPNN